MIKAKHLEVALDVGLAELLKGVDINDFALVFVLRHVVINVDDADGRHFLCSDAKVVHDAAQDCQTMPRSNK